MAKGLKNWFEIFKAGTHFSSNGRKRTWTNEDLDKIVEATNFSVPLVVGHVKVNYPVYGSAESFKRVGSKLYAKCNQVRDEFEQFVKDSSKGLSVSINPDYTLNHIAFLAVEEPALTDLAPIEFNSPTLSNEAESYDYSDYKFRQISTVLSSLRDFFIEKFGLETADTIVGKWQLSTLDESTDTQKNEISSFSEKQEDLNLDPKDAKIKELEAQLTAKKETEEKTEFAKREAEKDSKIKDLEAKLAEQKLNEQKAEFSSFCDELVNECTLTPAQKTAALEVFEFSTQPASYDFSEGKNELAESVKKLLKTLPKQFEKGAFDFSKADTTAQDVDLNRGNEIANSLK